MYDLLPIRLCSTYSSKHTVPNINPYSVSGLIAIQQLRSFGQEKKSIKGKCSYIYTLENGGIDVKYIQHVAIGYGIHQNLRCHEQQFGEIRNEVFFFNEVRYLT